MALRNQEKFEQMDSAETATATLERPEPTNTVKLEPSVAKTAVAVAPAARTAVQPMKFSGPALAAYENVIDPKDVTFGTFEKITTTPGSFTLEGETNIGSEIVIQVLSWNHRWVASPGSDDDAATDLAKYSLDGVTLDENGASLNDYIRELQTVHGYKDARKKEYLAIWCMLTAKGGVEVPPAERAIMELQCSPATLKKWNAFRITQGVLQSQGVVADTDLVRCKAHIGKNGKNTFGYATFSAA
jgi:hypothetical protein